jgi:hypothetical protein
MYHTWNGFISIYVERTVIGHLNTSQIRIPLEKRIFRRRNRLTSTGMERWTVNGELANGLEGDGYVTYLKICPIFSGIYLRI